MKTLIVNFHYIRNKKYKYDGIHPITKNAFIKIIKKFKNKNYNFISPNELGNSNSFLKKKNVMFTFDDGLKDHLNILKILEKFKIKGLFFICTKPFKNEPLDVHTVHFLRSITHPNKMFNYLVNKFPNKFKLLYLVQVFDICMILYLDYILVY